MSAMKHWVLALRPRTLSVSVAPVAIGAAIAFNRGVFDVVAAVFAVVGALLLQIVSNLANDYYDFKNGADTDERIGPTRATQAGLITPAAMRTAFIGVLLLAMPIGGFLIFRGGWPIVVVAVASCFAAVLYTGGPRPLGYMGLGDPMVFLFFGPVAVAGTVLVQTGPVSLGETLALPAVVGATPGLLAMNVLIVNNLRDRFTDAACGKKTLAVRWGGSGARLEYIVSTTVALALIALLVALGYAPATTLIALVSTPVWARLIWAVNKKDGAALNPYLGKTAGALVVTSALLAVGWWIG